MISSELLQSLTGRHPARCIPFDHLYDELNRLCARKEGEKPLIVKSVHKNLEIYNYSRDCMYERTWNLFTCISRGLVIDAQARKILATSWPKFFNWGEDDCFWTPSGESMSVYEKVDGCLGIVFYDGERWRLASRGSFTGDVQQAGQKMLDGRQIGGILTPGHTYLFEILTSVQRIVVPYPFEGLVLLGGYDEQGYELPWDKVGEIADLAGFKLPSVQQFSTVDEVVAYTKPLDYHQEGFIIRFEGGHRIKIKSDGYLEKHKLMFNFGPLAVWDSFVSGGSRDYRARLPEEIWAEFDKLWSLFERKYDEQYREIAYAHELTKHLSDRDLGQNMKERVAGEAAHRFLWGYRKGGFREEVKTPGSDVRKRFCEWFRPTGNKVEELE